MIFLELRIICNGYLRPTKIYTSRVTMKYGTRIIVKYGIVHCHSWADQ